MSKRRIYVDTNVLVNYFTKQADDVQCLDYFEDSVHYVLSEKLKCSVIITNNISDFSSFRNKIITLTPRDLRGVKRVVK
jgi:predicted nucleic acid-binding protein